MTESVDSRTLLNAVPDVEEVTWYEWRGKEPAPDGNCEDYDKFFGSPFRQKEGSRGELAAAVAAGNAVYLHIAGWWWNELDGSGSSRSHQKAVDLLWEDHNAYLVRYFNGDLDRWHEEAVAVRLGISIPHRLYDSIKSALSWADDGDDDDDW